MLHLLERYTKVRAFTVGICIGLLANMLILESAIASLQPATQTDFGGLGPPPVVFPEWDRSDYIEVNSMVYETLFEGTNWDSSSTMKISKRQITPGRNDGVTDLNQPFVLQAMTVDHFGISDIEHSLLPDELLAWQDFNVQATILIGLMIEGEGDWSNYERIVPVLGISYSSDVSPSSQIMIFSAYGNLDTEALLQYWFAKAHQTSFSVGNSVADWSFWWSGCQDPWGGLVGESLTLEGSDECILIRENCISDYEYTMNLATGIFKVTVGTAGAGCIPGLILSGAFCLVGNLIACAGGIWLAKTCAGIVAAGLATLGATHLVANELLLECLGPCGFTDYGCP